MACAVPGESQCTGTRAISTLELARADMFAPPRAQWRDRIRKCARGALLR
jgi:hypothetical protein